MRAIGVLVAVCLLAAVCTRRGNSPASTASTASNGPVRPDSTAPAQPAQTAQADQAAPSGATALRITSPHSGEVLALPATVQYELDAAPVNPVIRVYSGTAPTGGYRDFNLSGPRGSITLPDDKTLAGHRTLTFCLAADGRLVDGTCQTLVLTLTGRK